MRNRSGLDYSNKAVIAALHLTEQFEHFLNQYINLYETDKDFEAIIDPFQVIVLEKPSEATYVAALNRANRHIGGLGNANDPNEPIQFQYGKNWMLSIPSGEFLGLNYEAVLQDFRLSLKEV